MLSVLFGEQFNIFKEILEFYFPKGANILDITFGHGKLWISPKYNKGSSFDYRVTTSDLDPDSPAQYHLGFQRLEEIGQKFDGIIYDPPYKYDEASYIFWQRTDKDWTPIKTKWTLDSQIKSAKILNITLPKILNKNGFLIIKIMDTSADGQLIPNHKILMDLFTNFQIKDILIYVRLGIGVFVNAVTPQTAHGYFLIFKLKSEAENIEKYMEEKI